MLEGPAENIAFTIASAFVAGVAGVVWQVQATHIVVFVFFYCLGGLTATYLLSKEK